MKAAIYARVSTEGQEASNQIPALQKLARQRGWKVVDIYQEEASAWKAGHQRELSRMVEDARLGKFEIVLVWALDRLTREGVAAIFSIYNKLGRYGCRVVSYQDPWTETASPELAELLLSVAAWVARMESARRSERTKAGQARAVKEGKVLGRPKGSPDTKKRKTRGYFLRHAK